MMANLFPLKTLTQIHASTNSKSILEIWHISTFSIPRNTIWRSHVYEAWRNSEKNVLHQTHCPLHIRKSCRTFMVASSFHIVASRLDESCKSALSSNWCSNQIAYTKEARKKRTSFSIFSNGLREEEWRDISWRGLLSLALLPVYDWGKSCGSCK